MSTSTGIGIIGCGNIAAQYLRLAPQFKGIELRGVADLNMEAAQARGAEFDVPAYSVDDLLNRADIDIVVNLTIPAAHVAVSTAILNAGKHVYSEKPFVLSTKEGEDIRALAAEKGLRVASAPDTFLGGAHQLARHIVDSGLVGDITSGTAMVQSHGMEHWHPNPDFFFLPGAGPILDLGPYYISNLVQLIGPVKSVQALASTPSKTRVISNGPRNGQEVPVKTPTTIHALLEFHSGAIITLISSWDVWAHEHANMELYGSKGSLFVPDPNFFGGALRLTSGEDAAQPPAWDHPFGIPNEGDNANYRCAGLADMATAIREGRAHRCSLDFAHHVVDVMSSILDSAEKGAPLTLTTTCERPAALGPEAARAMLR